MEYGLLLESDIEREGNGQIIIDQLNDPESRKGKLFVFSNTQDGLSKFVKVNDTEKYVFQDHIQMLRSVSKIESLTLSRSSILKLIGEGAS